MAAPEGTTMNTTTDVTTELVGGAYATYKDPYATKDYPAEGTIRLDTLVLSLISLPGRAAQGSERLLDARGLATSRLCQPDVGQFVAKCFDRGSGRCTVATVYDGIALVGR